MQKVKAHMIGERIFSNTPEAHALYKKSCWGELVKEKIQYSLSEVLFLIEKEKMEIYSSRDKKISKKELINKFRRIDKKILTKYAVYNDLRERGYIVKTALKFGAEFRVYDKGSRPGKKHARWIVFTSNESEKLTWYEFSAKNRIAHSTRKKLLLAIIDEEGAISYYEVGWVKP